MILHGHLGTLASALVSIAALSACLIVARGCAEAGPPLSEAPRQPPGLDVDEGYSRDSSGARRRRSRARRRGCGR